MSAFSLKVFDLTGKKAVGTGAGCCFAVAKALRGGALYGA